MLKLTTPANELVAVACVAVIYGMGFIAWRTWRMSRTLESIADTLRDLTRVQSNWQEWTRQQDLAEAEARLNGVSPSAVNIIVDGMDIFPADPRSGKIGIGVFTVRNVGNDAVLLLGITRTAGEQMPQDPARLLGPYGSRDLSLRLDPADPPLDESTVTIWYRDLLGRHWLRSLSDAQASLVTEDPPPPATAAPGELPVVSPDVLVLTRQEVEAAVTGPVAGSRVPDSQETGDQ